eukprot:15452067-Alexandrium_andersonii.AAC.1
MAARLSAGVAPSRRTGASRTLDGPPGRPRGRFWARRWASRAGALPPPSTSAARLRRLLPLAWRGSPAPTRGAATCAWPHPRASEAGLLASMD